MGGLHACILVNTEIGAEHKVAKAINSLASAAKVTAEVIVTYGTYDIAVCARASGMEALDKLVTEIRSIGEVKATVTLIGTPIG